MDGMQGRQASNKGWIVIEMVRNGKVGNIKTDGETENVRGILVKFLCDKNIKYQSILTEII